MNEKLLRPIKISATSVGPTRNDPGVENASLINSPKSKPTLPPTGAR
jgi:hypothetical protein